METSLQVLSYCPLLNRSYRTYEEWKRARADRYQYLHSVRSYRAYEEWKPNFSISSPDSNLSSYRTYEEWKLLVFVCKLTRNESFLPYL